MKINRILFLLTVIIACFQNFTGDNSAQAQERRPIDSEHPLWLVHIDVWNKADPLKIINLIPDDIKPYVCMNLSMSCSYDTERNVYTRPQSAIRTYKSWASVCQNNGVWFTCQPASGGHTHIQDNDLATFEYFYKRYPNFLGWNYAEQFWGFDEPGDKSSSSQASRIALFAKLVPMAHKYGGFLTVSFCGNIYSHALNPLAMMKRNPDLLDACRRYPEAILWLYKYTTSTCFYNNESVTFGPFVSGLAKNYGVRYDNCGWDGTLEEFFGKNHPQTYPEAAGIGTVMEQTCQNGGAVWDGPELIWTQDFKNLSETTTADGYRRRNWGYFAGFPNVWLDMYRKIIDGTMYIPTREEVVEGIKVVTLNDIADGDNEAMYATWGSLFDGLYKANDPFNRGNGQMGNNFCYLKGSGRYGTIPMVLELADDKAKAIPNVVKKSERTSVWATEAAKVDMFNSAYPKVSDGDMFVSRFKNQLVTYTPYTYLNKKTKSSASVPLKYNTCESLDLEYGKLSSGIIREYADHITLYLNNFRSDTTSNVTDKIIIRGAKTKPSYTLTKRVDAKGSSYDEWNEASGTYTLTISHNGAVDVDIRCAGNATDRSTDYASSKPLALPKQPDASYNGELIIEAEDMDYKNIASCMVYPYENNPDERGHSGNGYMDMGTSQQGSLKTVVNVKKAGTYNVSVRFTSPNKSGNIYCKMNGERTALKCDKTAKNEWKKATYSVSMNSGENTFIIDNPLGISMYIDQVIFAPADASAEKFSVVILDAADGSAVSDVDSAEEGKTVRLSVAPNDGFAFVGWNIIHGDINIADDGTFVMPDDNVTLQPIFEDLTVVYKMDFTTSSLPEGWRATQGTNDVHEYPNQYGQGARSFSGFEGTYNKALYWRIMNCEYGMQQKYPLTLTSGKYKLNYVMAAWKGTPRFKAQILTSAGKVVAESDYNLAAPNANGKTEANLSSAEVHELEFDVEVDGNYVIRFENEGTGYSEFLLADCQMKKVPSGAADIRRAAVADLEDGNFEIYNAQGVRIQSLQRGLNIIRQNEMVVNKIMIVR